MLTSLVALALLGADAGPVAVVATSKRPGTEALGPKVASRVLELLKREGISNTLDDAQTLKILKDAEFPDPRACNGGQKCVQKLALLLGPRAVMVSVDVAKIGKSLAIHLEGLSATGGEPLAASDVSAAVDTWKEQSAVGIITFARELKQKLAEPPPPPVAVAPPEPPPDAPKQTPIAPQPTVVSSTELTDEAPSRAGRTGAWVAVGSGAAALILAAVFVGLGAGDKSSYDGKLFMDPLTGEQAFRGSEAERVALRSSGNLKFTLALSSALLGAALGGLGAWLFLKD